jgi:ferredoxin
MLDDETKQKGYALLCVSYPLSDCKIRCIEEVRPAASSRLRD